MHLVTRAGYPLPPEAYLIALSLDITLQNPLEYDFAFAGTCGSAGGEATMFDFKSTLSNMVNAFDRLSKTTEDAPDAVFLKKQFNKLFFESILEL